MDFVALCRGFMKERTESQFRDLDASLKVSYVVHNTFSVNYYKCYKCLRITLEKRKCNCKNWFVHFQDRMMLSLADLITMATFLSITPSIKDAFNSASARGEKKGTCTRFFWLHSPVRLSSQDKWIPWQKLDSFLPSSQGYGYIRNCAYHSKSEMVWLLI